jgi:hypothetical protein
LRDPLIDHSLVIYQPPLLGLDVLTGEGELAGLLLGLLEG